MTLEVTDNFKEGLQAILSESNTTSLLSLFDFGGSKY